MLNLDKVPKNLEECLAELDNLETKDKNFLKAHGSVSVHHSFGTWLRNNWSLWEKGTPLVLWFNKQGIHHADDMSAIILEAFVCKLFGKEYNLQEKIDYFRRYWKEECNVDPDTMKPLD